jgi:hypothetical protein
LFDIETAPNCAYVWGWYEQNVIDVKKDWYVLSFAFKWLGEKKTKVYALPDYPGYERDRENDKALLQDLWTVFDQADVLIGHNSIGFDQKKAAARFVAHGMDPPSPYQSCDTLKIARKHFAFSSNKLTDLGRYLGVGRKTPHTGAKLWFDCMRGDPKAWALMRKYNIRDVELLEEIYLKLRPWATTHPNLTFMTRQLSACGTCQSPNTQHRGWNYSRTGKRRRIQCQDCGAWSATGNLVREK